MHVSHFKRVLILLKNGETDGCLKLNVNKCNTVFLGRDANYEYIHCFSSTEL